MPHSLLCEKTVIFRFLNYIFAITTPGALVCKSCSTGIGEMATSEECVFLIYQLNNVRQLHEEWLNKTALKYGLVPSS